jgi:hypothetical protein
VLDGRCSQSVSNRLTLPLARVISNTLKIKAARSSETSVYIKTTRRHIPEDGVLNQHFFVYFETVPAARLYSMAERQMNAGWISFGLRLSAPNRYFPST